MYFIFDGIKEEITLSKDGAFLNNENYKNLNNVVAFIENNYPDVEKSMVLPKNDVLELNNFTL